MWRRKQEQAIIVSNEPELRKLKFLYGIFTFFIIASIIMPQYFGIDIGYDITCARFSNILFVCYMIGSPMIMSHFIKTTLQCEIFYPLCLYLFVAAYTMVFRGDVNAFFLVFFEALLLFMMIYGIRYVIGYQRAIRWVNGCAYFLGIYGLVEFLYGKSLFLQFFATVPTNVINHYRSGHYRIMGPCGHPLGYGLLLLLFIAIACIDLEKNEIYLFKRPVLLALLYINVFLTGSRSTLGIALLEMGILLVFSGRRNIKKSLFYLTGILIIGGLFLLVLYDTGMGRYLMGQITSVIDQFFDTNFAANFGIDTVTLENSSNYREILPKIFELDWLNPLVGRGRGFTGAEIDGIYIHSIDNYYIVQYIKYAYPGLFVYVLFMVTLFVVLIRNFFNKEGNVSVIAKIVFIGSALYFLNLWWVDALQTLKYLYSVVAIFYAAYLEERDLNKHIKVERFHFWK